MGKIRKFFGLSSTQQRLVIGSTTVLVAVRVGLWMLPFRRVRKMIAAFAEPHRPAPLARPSAEQISWAVAAAGACVPAGRNCLAQACAAEVMLGRFGYPSELKIGVAKKQSGEFEAHAWLESEGRVLVGRLEAARFTTLEGPGMSGL